jgi:sugar phosphate isomerase/epimerase
MNLCFSTLACPDWTISQILAVAAKAGYSAIELRFVENEDSLWKLPAFQGTELTVTKRRLQDLGIAVSCVDTSCRFHFPEVAERKRWLDEGQRMADVAATLGAPGIRVFGDTIQPGSDRESTRTWIADSLRKLAENIRSTGVSVWLETHGDFAGGAETAAIVAEAAFSGVGVVWDPANCFLQFHERPREGAAHMGSIIRHVHVKDLRQNGDAWNPVLTGNGTFPLAEVRIALDSFNYRGFISFEWEKKWHPEIPDANIALPQFAQWFRENWHA